MRRDDGEVYYIEKKLESENGKFLNFKPKKNINVHAKWKPKKVNYTLNIMIESNPETTNTRRKYEYLTSYKNIDQANFMRTQGFTDSLLQVYMNKPHNEEENITAINYDDFSDINKLEQVLNLPKNTLQGFHLNVEKSNEYKTKINGDGSTAKLLYFDRDEVHLKFSTTPDKKEKNYIEEFFKDNDGDFSKGYVYGATLAFNEKTNNPYTRIKNKINNYVKSIKPNYGGIPKFHNAKLSERILSTPLTLTQEATGDKIEEFFEKKIDPTTKIPYWELPLSYYASMGNSHGVIFFYYGKQGERPISSKTEDELIDLKNRLLFPGIAKEPNDVGPLNGIGSINSEDMSVFEGFKTPGDRQRENLYEKPNLEKLYEMVTGHKYLPGKVPHYFAVKYDRQKYNLDFQVPEGVKKADGTALKSQNITGVPYDQLLIGENREFKDKNVEENIQNYMSQFTQAEYDKDGDITNRDKVTKNKNGEVFDGWYLDPAYSIKFDPKEMHMPGRNIKIFSKWSKIYHHIWVHKYPQTSNTTNNSKNIIEIKVAEGEKLSESDSRLEYVLPQGYTIQDFLGWLTYGEAKDQNHQENKIPVKNGGSPYIYNFDTPVNVSFHLYPTFEQRKARVVYLFNYDLDPKPLTDEEVNKYSIEYINNDGEALMPNKAYMSKFWYNLESKIRLRAPLGFEQTENKEVVIEPKAPEGTKAYNEGKVFIGWRIYTRNYQTGGWTPVGDELYYYNSEFTIDKNNITYATTTSQNSALGALMLVAQWADADKTTFVEFYSNYGDDDQNKNIQDGIIINHKDFKLPKASQFDFEKKGYQFKGWNTSPDGSGRSYHSGEHVNVDDIFEKDNNKLYAQWERLYKIDLTKKWSDDKQRPVKIGLMRRLAVGPHYNPDFNSTEGFIPVEGSLKDLPKDNHLEWTVEGLNEEGKRYAYITVEIQPGQEELFKKKNITWKELGVHINQNTRQKIQQIELKDINNEVDTFTAATARHNKENMIDDNGEEIKGYNFEVNNTRIDVKTPIIEQPYTGDKEIKVIPPRMEEVINMTITFPNEVKIVLDKKDYETWVDSSDPSKEYKIGDDGRIVITTPNNVELEKDQKIKAFGTNKTGVESKLYEVIVKDRDYSSKTEAPEQKKKKTDSNGNSIVPIVAKTSTTSLLSGTKFILQDAEGNDIKDTHGKAYEGTIIDGDVVFNIPESSLENGKTYRILTTEPEKKPSYSEISAPIDLKGPILTTQNVVGKVGEDISSKDYKINTDEEASIVKRDSIQSDIKIQNEKQKGTEWKMIGVGQFKSERKINITVEDKFGNITEGTFNVIVTDKDLVDAPKIDEIKVGDTTVKIIPPITGDTLIITTLDDNTVTLKKDKDGNWKDEADKIYPVTDGKISVETKTLKEGDIISAQGKDSTGKLADSPVVNQSVGKSKYKTPTPQFDKITVEDKEIIIRPVDEEQNNIITDKLVITVRNDGTEEKKIILLKDKDGNWKDEAGELTVKKETNGKLIVKIPEGLILTSKHSFGATGEDTKHGHAISDPASINVNAKQSKKPTKSVQTKNDKDGNHIIIGSGEPGADITIYDSKTGDKIVGPVKVDDQGNFTITVPKDKVSADKVIDVKQKEDGKPESESERVTIDNVSPEKPTIDQPSVGDKSISVTPPKDLDAEKIIVMFPDGTKTELVKQPDGTWKDEKGQSVKEENKKLIVPTPQNILLKDKDKIMVQAEDHFGNKSEKDEKTVNTENSFKAENPKQKKNERDNIIITADIPKDATPEKGTEYTLEDTDGKSILDSDGQPIKGTVIDGKIQYEVPKTLVPKNNDGTEKEIILVITEPKKTPNKEAKLIPDATGPEIDANDVSEMVNVELANKDDLKIVVKDKTLEALDFNNSKLPVGVEIEKVADIDGKLTWQLKGKPRDIIKMEENYTITYTATDKFGNKTEKTVKVVISDAGITEKPILDPIKEGDKTIYVRPPDSADRVTITWPDGTKTEINKDKQGYWNDKNGNQILFENGKLAVSIPVNTILKPLDVVKANAQDREHHKAVSEDDTKAVGVKSNQPTAKQGETKEDGTKIIIGTGVPGSEINVYDPNTRDKIAGPITVNPDGTYTVELPDSIKDGDNLNVTQTEKDKSESAPVQIKITEDIKEVSENDPIEDGRVRVIFDATTKGELDGIIGGKKYFDVVTDRLIDLSKKVNNPVGIQKDGLQFMFKEWDKILKAQIKENIIITALYNNKWIDIIPIPGLSSNTIVTNIDISPTEDEYRNAIQANGNMLPDDATVIIDQPANVSTFGDKEAKVTVIFADGSKSTIVVPVKVLKDIYPSWDGERQAEVPDSYVKVTLDPTDKGYYDNGPKTFYVRPNVEVTIPAHDAKGVVINGIENIFDKWNQSLKNIFTEDTIIIAQYKKGKDYNEKKPNPSIPPQRPCPIPDPIDPIPTSKDIHKLYVIGYPEGEFLPEEGMTRAEVAMIFARLIEDKVFFERVNTRYNDVKADHWASGAIKYLTEKGILKGRPDGKFYPEEKITRAEYATIIANMKMLRNAKNNMFTDIASHWAEANIKAIANDGIIEGYGDGTFRPEKAISRAEAVKMTTKAFDRVGDKDYIENNLEDKGIFPDVQKAHWAYKDIYEAATTHKFERKEDRTEKWIEILEYGRVLGMRKK